MLNKLWPLFIIISFIFAFFTGNIEKVNSGIFESTKSAVELSLTFLGTMCLWNGIMQMAYKSKLINVIVKILNPIIKIVSMFDMWTGRLEIYPVLITLRAFFEIFKR